MNKSELIDAVADHSGLTKISAEQAVNAVLEVVMDAVAQGDGVNIVGFGAFKATARAARQGTNPKTGEKIQIPSVNRPKFVPGATFKQRVAKD